MKIVGRELEAREKTFTNPETNTLESRSSRKSCEKPSVATLVSNSEVVGSNSLNCCYCQRNHTPDSCTTVTDVKERQKMLKTGGRCFVCTRRGHLARECRSRFRCRNCRGRHHRSICQSPGGALASEESTQQSSTNMPTQSVTRLLTLRRHCETSIRPIPRVNC